jgi:hypothetical protein
MNMTEIFGEPISIYTRRQAIEDGVLVDLMQPETLPLVREAGFKFPVAMTSGAWKAAIGPIGGKPPDGQDLKGRLWDVLWMLKIAIRAIRPLATTRIDFQVRVSGRLVPLYSVCGPGDDAEPVITIMLPGED